MNTKTLIVSLVLGSASVAMADPGVTLSAPAQGAVIRDQRFEGFRAPPPVVRDHRDGAYDDDAYGRDDDANDRDGYDRDGYDDRRREHTGWHPGWDGGRPLPPVARPVTLASSLAFGREGRAFITVGRQAGRFSTLRLHASGGRTFIKQVYIQFENGEERVLRDLDRTLVGRESLSLSLGCHAAIRRVVVYGDSSRGGWRRAPGAFTVTAA